jgi:nucleotide-binding universal stress UspA family protein
MKTIVVGVDGSELSRAALQKAVELARSCDARLRAVHVTPPGTRVSPEVGAVMGDLDPADREETQKVLEDAVAHAKKLGMACEAISLMGEPADTLADFAQSPDVWMVVVGSIGWGPIERHLVGSVAHRLTRLCQKPVLVVR